MNISNFSIKRPVTVLMLIVAMLIFGFISLPKMAIELYPDMSFPVVMVATSYNGATPTEVENLVTKPIESAVGTLPNIDTISSTSVTGASNVMLQFNWGVDLDKTTQDVREKLDKVRGQLPDSANSPTIIKMDPNSQPIITLALTGNQDANALKKIAEDKVQNSLERIEGVASVSVAGGQSRIIEIIPDPAKLQAYGITNDQIKQAIASTNQSASAGSVREGDTKQSIEVIGEFKRIQSIAKTPINVGNSFITLDQLATITDTHEEITQKAYLNGVPSVQISVTKATGGNTIEIADAVKKQLAVIQKDLPSDTKLTTTDDSSTIIKDSIYGVAEHAIVGGIFSILILYLFLNSVRSVLIVAIVIPISIVATFSLMYFYGITLNLMSLSGLTLGLGSLVDFAVVILENIFRHRQQGKSMMEAAKLGSAQVGNAVMASALAQISVFLPIAFVDGIAAEIFTPLALAVVFSHIAALVVSLLLVPMLSSRWLDKIAHDETDHIQHYRGWNPITWFNVGFNRISQAYGRLLGWALTHRKTVLVAVIALFVGSTALFPLIGMEFMPGGDQGKISVSIKMPSGTIFSEAEKAVSKVEESVKKIPELESWTTTVGGGSNRGYGSSSSQSGSISVQLVDVEKRSRATEAVVEELRKNVSSIAGAQVTVSEQQSGPSSSGSAIQFNLRGDDINTLKDISSVMVSEISKVEGTRNVKSSLEDTNKEYQVVVDPERASMYGLTTSQVISGVRTAFQGDTVTKFKTGDDEIDVQLKMRKEYQQDITYLKQLRITTAQGANIPLSSVADLVEADMPQTIQRSDMTRQVQITGELAGRDLGSVSKEIEQRLSAIKLPDGYTLETGGSRQNMMEAFVSLAYAIVLAIVLVYMVMAGQFESLFTPFVIMFSIPTTLIGVLIGLVVTDTTLSVNGLVGYIMLIGIVVNNAIVLIDFVNNLRQEGVERNEAIKQAGPVRLRPILMTTFATILAVLPMAFGSGSGSESQRPMAVVVAFGLLFSTLITLVLVPVVYTWFDDIGQKMRNRRKNKKNKRNAQIQTVENLQG